MLAKGAAKKVTIYVNEDTRHHLGPVYEAILAFLMHKGVAGATASRSLAGFGAHHVMHTAKVEALSEHLPIRIEFIETAEKVEELLPTLHEMVSDGLIEVQDTTIIQAANRKPEPVPKPPHTVRREKAKLMQVFLGEADQWHGEPLYQAIVKRPRMMEISGATVSRGILGYGAKGHTHKQSFLHLSRDLPIVISVVDTEEKLAQASRAVEEMIEDGLIVLADVDAVRLLGSLSPAEKAEARS